MSSRSTDAARRAVAGVARALAAAGLVEAFGHVSARLPAGGMAITSTRPLGDAGHVDVLVLGPDGTVLDGPADDRPLEVPLHAAVYAARPDVRGICRGHPADAVVWGTGTGDLPAVHGLGLLAGARVRVHDDVRLVSTPERGAAAAARLADDHALLLRANGALAVGADLTEAATRLAAVAERARVALAARAAGLDTTDVAHPDRLADSPAELRRAVRWFVATYADAATADAVQVAARAATEEEEPC